MQTTTYLLCSSDSTGTRNQIFGYPKSAENGFKVEVEQDFSSFFTKFLEYVMFHFKKSSNMVDIWKKIRKALFNLPKTHFSMAFQKPEFWVPDPSLLCSCPDLSEWPVRDHHSSLWKVMGGDVVAETPWQILVRNIQFLPSILVRTINQHTLQK